MKLLSLHIENFGKLSGYDHVFTEGLNVIKHENSWGKTTLATFLKAMFFGMEKKGNLKAYSAERSKYAPWQGGVYGGSVIFEVNGKVYRVLRTFAPTPEGDRFELIDLETNKPSKDFSSNLGEEIFGVGRETFALSTFFPQGELEGKINDEIRSYLSGANDISGDVEMQSKAVKKLKNMEREYRLTCPKAYEIISLEEQIDDNKARLAKLEDERENLKDDINSLSKQIENFKLPSLDGGENPARIAEQISQIENNIQRVEEQQKKLHQRHRQRKTISISGMVSGGVVATIGVLLAALSVSLIGGMATAVVGAILAATGIIMLVFGNKKLGREILPLQEETNQLLQQKRRAEEAYRALAAQSSAMLEEANSRKQLEVELAIDKTKLEHIEKDIAQVLERLDECETILASKKTLKDELEEKQKIVECVIECLSQAQENISKRYVQPMQQQFNAIIENLSNGKHIMLDSDLNITLDTQSGLKEKAYLSAGNQDLVEICKRFALVKSIFKSQSPFIILDDPFVNLDEISLQNMLKLVKDFAREMQIIYLVCHSSRVGE